MRSTIGLLASELPPGCHSQHPTLQCSASASCMFFKQLYMSLPAKRAAQYAPGRRFWEV